MSDVRSVTAEDLRRVRWRFLLHINGGSNGHTLAYECVEHPRLAYSRTSRRGRIVATSITVDGNQVPSLAAAAEALSKPPIEPAPQPAPEPPAQGELAL